MATWKIILLLITFSLIAIVLFLLAAFGCMCTGVGVACLIMGAGTVEQSLLSIGVGLASFTIVFVVRHFALSWIRKIKNELHSECRDSEN